MSSVWIAPLTPEVVTAQENLEVPVQHQEQEELPVPTGVSCAAQSLEPRFVPDVSAGTSSSRNHRSRIQLPKTIAPPSEEEAVGSADTTEVPRPIRTHRHQHLLVKSEV